MSRQLQAEPDTYLVEYRVMEKATARDVFFEVQRRHPEFKFVNADPIVKHVGKGWWVDVPLIFNGGTEEDVKRKFDEAVGYMLYELKVRKIEVPSGEGEA